MKDIQEFKLENGLTIRYQQSDQWDGLAYVRTPFERGEKGLLNIAASHLIEHCIVGPYDGRTETRQNMVRYGLKDFNDKESALSIFNEIAASFSNVELKNFSLEKEHIVQEFCHLATQPDKFRFLGFLTKAVSSENWNDYEDERITAENGYYMLNRQADYTKTFTQDEIKKHALAIYCAENLTLDIKSPLSMEEFQNLIKDSNLERIPTRHFEGELLELRDVPRLTHYDNMKISKLHLNVVENIDNKEAYREIFQKISHSLSYDKNIAMYSGNAWIDGAGKNKTWNFIVSSDRENLLKDKIRDGLEFLSKDENLKDVVCDIQKQLSHLLNTEKTLPLTLSNASVKERNSSAKNILNYSASITKQNA